MGTPEPKIRRKRRRREKRDKEQNNGSTLGLRINLLSCLWTSGDFRLFYHHHVLGLLDAPDYFALFPAADDRAIAFTIANLRISGDLRHERSV